MKVSCRFGSSVWEFQKQAVCVHLGTRQECLGGRSHCAAPCGWKGDVSLQQRSRRATFRNASYMLASLYLHPVVAATNFRPFGPGSCKLEGTLSSNQQSHLLLGQDDRYMPNTFLGLSAPSFYLCSCADSCGLKGDGFRSSVTASSSLPDHRHMPGILPFSEY